MCQRSIARSMDVNGQRSIVKGQSNGPGLPRVARRVSLIYSSWSIAHLIYIYLHAYVVTVDGQRSIVSGQWSTVDGQSN